jgi:hypothetical protein
MEESRMYSVERKTNSDDQLFTVPFDQGGKIKVEENPSGQPSSATHKELAEIKMEDNSNDQMSFADCVKQEYEEER